MTLRPPEPPAPPDAQDGSEALRGHLADIATRARARYGPVIDMGAMERLLEDREVVRFPTTLRFDASLLKEGEFAWPRPLGDRPQDGFELVLHPLFEHRPDILPLLIAYHLVSVNYLDIADHEEAELFGATLLGLDQDDYYRRICECVDSSGIGASVGG